jgi:hypothetical protein
MEKNYKTEDYIKKGIRFNETEDYCSSFYEKLFGVCHKFSCYLHDRQYRNEVTKRLTRFEADNEFRKNILLIYKLNRKPLAGYLVSILIFLGVRIFAAKNWEINKFGK